MSGRKDAYHNIQGRRAGKATRDLHYTQRTFAGREAYRFKLTNAERNLFRKVLEEVERQKVTRKQYQTTRLMRLLIMLKRLLGL